MADEHEAHRAYLDHVASAVEASAHELREAGRGTYEAAGGAVGDLLATVLRPRG
jgi:hypothetical protein